MATSHTELSTFRRCPREWYFSYVLYREPVVTPGPLKIGKRVDVALKRTLRGEAPDLSLLEPKERALVIGHSIRWKDTLTVERVDVPFKVRIGSVEVSGEMDAIGIWHGGASLHDISRRVLVECKTTSEDISPGSGYWRRVTQVDIQATIYLRAARDLGLSEPFLIWDALKKPIHRQKQNENDDDFTSRVLGEITEDLPRYYQRAEIVRHDVEHDAVTRDIEGTVHLMQATRMHMAEAPRNPDACFKWGRECAFFPVCSGATTIEDPVRYKQKERREKRAVVVEKPAEERKWEF